MSEILAESNHNSNLYSIDINVDLVVNASILGLEAVFGPRNGHNFDLRISRR